MFFPWCKHLSLVIVPSAGLQRSLAMPQYVSELHCLPIDTSFACSGVPPPVEAQAPRLDQVCLRLGEEGVILSRIADPQGCWICFMQLHTKLLAHVPRETLKGLLHKAGDDLLGYLFAL